MYPVSDEYIAAMKAPVRRDKITGAIKLRDGTIFPIDDSVIAQNSLSITRSVCTSKFDIGTVNCAEMKLTIFDDSANDNEYGGAQINLKYSLCTDWENDVWESVQLPPFWVDRTQVTRKRSKLTIKAYDALSKLDVAMPDNADIPSDSLYSALQYIANYGAGMGLAISEEDFAKLPNADITGYSFANEKIQSCRDAVMWIAQLTATCAFTDYRGLLVLKMHNYDEGGVYDRGINAQERKSIEYTDTRTYLAYLAYYCGGEQKNYSNVVDNWGDDNEHIRAGALSLPDNPLVENLDATAQDAAAEAYFTTRSRPTRYIKSQGLIDPAVEPLDVLAFVGGSIDVHGGRIIAPVTSVQWKYRGIGSYTCLNYEEHDESADDGEAAAIALLADEDEGGETAAPARVPVKSQTEKRIDALAAKVGSSSFPPAPIEYKFNTLPNIDPTQGGGFALQSKDYNSYVNLDSGGVHIAVNECSNAAIYLYAADSTDWQRASYFNMNPWSINIEVASDKNNKLFIGGSSGVGGSFNVTLTADGSETTLRMNSKGLYFNGKKVLTED